MNKNIKRAGKEKLISHTVISCSLGEMLIAATEKGICLVQIGGSQKKLRGELQKEFHASELIEKRVQLKKWTQALVNYLAGKTRWPLLPYDVKASAFQRKVWEWLRTIPAGKTRHYNEVAKAIGKPKAARAVARACAANPVALVIPCHRILPKSGGIGGYRWKPERKRKLLDLELNKPG